jgi:hypothetical protein
MLMTARGFIVASLFLKRRCIVNVNQHGGGYYFLQSNQNNSYVCIGHYRDRYNARDFNTDNALACGSGIINECICFNQRFANVVCCLLNGVCRLLNAVCRLLNAAKVGTNAWFNQSLLILFDLIICIPMLQVNIDDRLV